MKQSKDTDNREDRAKIMGEVEIKKVLLKFAIPAIVAQLINAIYNLADTTFVGMLNDNAAMGAVSIAFPLIMIISSIGLTFGVGAASYISRCLGENRKEEADRTASTAFFTVLIIGAVFTVFSLIFLEPILKSLGATSTIMPYAVSYSRILLIGCISIMINMTLNNIIRAEGNAKFSMIAISLGAGLNIVLDPIFILELDMGVAGAAVATTIGQIISTIYLLQYFIRKKSYLKIDIKLFRFSKKIYSEIMKIGIPTFTRQMLVSVSLGLLNAAAAPYGDTAVAAVGITLRIVCMALYIVIGYNQGFMPIVGYNYGAKNYKRVHDAIKISLRWTTIFVVFVSIICITQAEALLRVFSEDTEVIAIGVNYIIAYSILTPFLGFELVYQSLFQAIGKSIPAGILSVARQGMFLIPGILILPSFFKNNFKALSLFVNILPNSMQPEMYGVVYTQFAADFITIIITTVFAVMINKELKKKSLENKVSQEISLQLEV